MSFGALSLSWLDCVTILSFCQDFCTNYLWLRINDMATAIGRPSTFSIALADEICRRLANGESTRQICMDDHMPDWSTLYGWLNDESNNPDRERFTMRYARARDSWLESLAQEMLSIGDEGQNDYMDRETARGRLIRTADRELVQRSQLRIATRQWLLSKLRPDKYGDRLAAPGGAEITINVRSVVDAKPEPVLELKPERKRLAKPNHKG